MSLRILAFTRALAEFVADGCTTVDREEYAARLAVCEPCERRQGLTCGECGCLIAVKAVGRTWDCPHPGGSRWQTYGEANERALLTQVSKSG